MRRILLWLLLLLQVASLPVSAAPAARAAVKKKMLAVFKSSEGTTAAENEVKWHLEAILQKQGWTLDYRDVDKKGLPDASTMAAYKAVVSWHRGAVYANPTAYVRWLRDQVLDGRKVLIFGNLGAHTSDSKTWLSNEVLNEFFQPFGLEYGAAYTADAKLLEVVNQSAEAHAPSPLTYYLLFKSNKSGNRSFLTVRRKDLPSSDSSLVVRTAKGGMAAEGYVFVTKDKKINWLIDRDKFLSSALETSANEKLTAPGGRLLALYKSSEGVNGETNYVNRFLKEPLKELGYTLDFQDIGQPLPDAATMARYAGVISWHQTASMENAAAYCNWLTAQIMAGRKVIVLGSLGAFQELDSHSTPPTSRWLLTHEYNSFLFPFGIEFKGNWTKDTAVLNVVKQDSRMVPWLEKSHLAHYYWMESVNAENKVYLSVNRSDTKNSESAFVVRTPYGGYVLESYLFRDPSGKGEYKWHVDMKAFLADCLAYKPTSLPTAWSMKINPSTPKNVAPETTLPARPELPAGTKEIKRRVLAFYQKDVKETSEKNRIHDNVETFLNHIGLVVDYRAIEDGLPSEAQMEPYRGILTWFQGANVPSAQAYADWLKTQIERGKLTVILGDYGAYQDKAYSSQVNPGPTLKALGVDWRAASPVTGITINRTNLTSSGTASIEYMDPVMCKAEHPINLNEPDLKKGWPVYLSADPANKVYLKVKDPDSQVCDAIIITPHGGLIAGEFLLYVPPAQPIKTESKGSGHDVTAVGPAVADETELPELRMDAFRFFGEAFQTQDLPRCDVTTLNGSRIYFSHVDGDAMQGMSLIDRASLNAEMLYREIISLYKLPVSVSFVTANLEFRATPTYKRELAAARKLLELPWVEVACHTQNHPFNWLFGDLRRRPGNEEGLVRLPPDCNEEIVRSLDLTNQFVAPAGKKCKTLLWSGMCNPTEEALKLTDGMGVVNMNGGDPVYDSIHPFLVGVSPLYAVVGGRYQFHTCAAGDFYYTGAWTKDYDGMKRLVEYYKYTEEPRRLRAMNIYYHFYLAERELGVQGLKVAMDYVLSQKPACMFVSNYVEIVKDMIVTRLGTDSAGNLVVSNSGAMRTIRIDENKQVPDLDRSAGVLGYNKVGDRLYIHLDDAKTHRIAWGQATPSKPYVERASHYINSWKSDGKGLSFSFKGTGPAFFTVGKMEPNKTYQVSVGGENKPIKADANGKLTWDGTLLTYEGVYPVRVTR